ncbi:MAG: hypothetical protein ACK40G_14210 [Cytophagaceae bacterium]
MKIKSLLFVAFVILMASCAPQHLCPTYSNAGPKPHHHAKHHPHHKPHH